MRTSNLTTGSRGWAESIHWRQASTPYVYASRPILLQHWTIYLPWRCANLGFATVEDVIVLLKYGNFGATFCITTGNGLNFCFRNNKHTVHYTKWRECQWVMLSVFEIRAQIVLISAFRDVTPSCLLHGLTSLKTVIFVSTLFASRMRSVRIRRPFVPDFRGQIPN